MAETGRPAVGHVTGGTACPAHVDARLDTPLGSTTLAGGVSTADGEVDTGGRRQWLERQAGTGRRTAVGDPVAGQTSNPTSDLPEERADGSAAVDHVEQRVDGAVTESHDLTDRQGLVQLDTIVGVDTDQTDDEVRSPAEHEADNDQHCHLHHGPLRRQRQSGLGRRSGVAASTLTRRLETGGTAERGRVVVLSPARNRAANDSGLVGRYEVDPRSIQVGTVIARTSTGPDNDNTTRFNSVSYTHLTLPTIYSV